MREYNPQTDSIGLAQLNQDLADEIRAIIAHMGNSSVHVSSADRYKWDNKIDIATGPVATSTSNGLMSATDKSKLNGIAYNANFYIHPKPNIVPGRYNVVVVDEYGHVIEGGTDQSIGNASKLGGLDASEYARLISPIFKGTPSITNTPDDDNLSAIANVRYVKQYVDKTVSDTYGITATDIANWNNKWDATNAPLVSSMSSGIMSSMDKNNLDRLVTLLNSVTSQTINSWNNKLSYDSAQLATVEHKGMMSPEDKQFLNNLAGINHINEDDIANWNNKLDVETGATATATANGLMSSEDKKYIDLLRNIDIISFYNHLLENTKTLIEQLHRIIINNNLLVDTETNYIYEQAFDNLQPIIIEHPESTEPTEDNG